VGPTGRPGGRRDPCLGVAWPLPVARSDNLNRELEVGRSLAGATGPVFVVVFVCSSLQWDNHPGGSQGNFADVQTSV
jgi:hypothetical protein